MMPAEGDGGTQGAMLAPQYDMVMRRRSAFHDALEGGKVTMALPAFWAKMFGC